LARRYAPPVKKPVVSVITPSLNQGSYVGATIESVRQQSFQDFEHIVVDGGSTDGTIEVLRLYEARYAMQWLSEPDGGMYEAINKGVRLASGEILCYLNSDDLFFPWTLETVVGCFARNADVDFVYGDALRIDDRTGRQDFYWTLPFDLDFIRRYGFLAQPAVFWRRSVVEMEGPFDESLRYVGDCDYWMRAGVRHRFRKVHEFLAIERDHPSTLRASKGGPVWSELDRVRARYVTLGGSSHRRLVRRHWVRQSLWTRLYAVSFLILSIIPGSRRGRPWRRLIETRSVSIHPLRLVLRAIPGFGRRYAGVVLRPSRRWLDPPAA
jgi:glycosyltransferase involved in cell wall biosynthesis